MQSNVLGPDLLQSFICSLLWPDLWLIKLGHYICEKFKIYRKSKFEIAAATDDINMIAEWASVDGAPLSLEKFSMPNCNKSSHTTCL